MTMCNLVYIHWYTGWTTQCHIGWIGRQASNQQESKLWAESQGFTSRKIEPFIVTNHSKKKSKAIPWKETMEANRVVRGRGPTVSRHSALRWWRGCRLYSPRRLLELIFVRSWFNHSTKHNVQLEGLGKLKKSYHPIGVWTHDLPTYSTMHYWELQNQHRKFMPFSNYNSVTTALWKLSLTNFKVMFIRIQCKKKKLFGKSLVSVGKNMVTLYQCKILVEQW
jgi:hypothetical protein